MTAPRWRFSLRSLFMAMTLIATLVAIMANYPSVTAFALIVTSPFFFAAGLATVSNQAPILARFLMICIAVLFVVTLALLAVLV